MSGHSNSSDHGSRFAEVLASPETGEEMGFRLVGDGHDPVVLIVGHGTIVDMVFEFITSHPLVAQLKGQLFLVRLDSLDHVQQPVADFFGSPSFDDFMFLPHTAGTANPIELASDACTSTLRFCRNIGLLPPDEILPHNTLQH